MIMIATPPLYSSKEEFANAATHGLGILLSITALVLMVVYSVLKGDGYHIVSTSIFGASLIVLYSMSTLYHVMQKPRLKKVFRTLDHSSIFLLIAGTYTPFTLVNLHGAWGWTLFGLVWGFALFGIIIETFTGQRLKRISLGLYIGMGWLILIAVVPLIENVEPGGLALLLAGGLSYTLGVAFYVWKSLFLNHAIWHLFVLAGSIFHFFAVFFYVIP